LRKRSPTPRKVIKKHQHCQKFKNNPLKFFSEPPCGIVLKALDFKEETIIDLKLIRDFKDTKDNKEFFFNTENNFRVSQSGSKIHPFSFNNETFDDYEMNSKSIDSFGTPMKGLSKRGRLNEIISKLNIEQEG
jgi:hypothetical protein